MSSRDIVDQIEEELGVNSTPYISDPAEIRGRYQLFTELVSGVNTTNPELDQRLLGYFEGNELQAGCYTILEEMTRDLDIPDQETMNSIQQKMIKALAQVDPEKLKQTYLTNLKNNKYPFTQARNMAIKTFLQQAIIDDHYIQTNLEPQE